MKRLAQEILLQNVSPQSFQGRVWLSALGARTCYSKKGLSDLLKDPRVSDKEKRVEYLKNLSLKKHFSVFSHTYAVVDFPSRDDALMVAANLFKTKYIDGTRVLVNLRHYLEAVLDVYDENTLSSTIEAFSEFDETIPEINYSESIPQVINIYRDNNYAVFFIDNVSRAMTHQLVRHTVLNFSQRSDRYVSNDENFMIIPEGLKSVEQCDDIFLPAFITDSLSKKIDNPAAKVLAEKANSVNDFSAYSAMEHLDAFIRLVYMYLVHNKKVKREDARAILPTNNRTTIVVSGTIEDIRDFISKREGEDAQQEIRTVALKMKEALNG